MKSSNRSAWYWYSLALWSWLKLHLPRIHRLLLLLLNIRLIYLCCIRILLLSMNPTIYLSVIQCIVPMNVLPFLIKHRVLSRSKGHRVWSARVAVPLLILLLLGLRVEVFATIGAKCVLRLECQCCKGLIVRIRLIILAWEYERIWCCSKRLQ